MLELRSHESMRDIAEADWNALLGRDGPPFLSWAFLDILEQTRCAVPERGWQPFHFTLHRGEEMVAAAPAYLKGNSEGEFVFDYSWAEFAEGRLGLRYYPKLLVAVPFTPATGSRLLIKEGEDAEAVTRAFESGVRTVVEKLGISSAHLLFPSEEETSRLAETRLLHRKGLQYHWQNRGYGSFDDFLSRLNSKRRNQLKREIRAPSEQGLAITSHSGRDLGPELVDAVFGYYLSTVNKYYWGRQYLNRAFFEEICVRLPDAVLVVLARKKAERLPVAGAFNLVGARAMYGRYWGAREEHPFLHFNVCYYRGIAECIDRGLSIFEPGAGGEHKLPRGFEPTVTHSFHHLRDERLRRVVADFLERERDAVDRHVREYELDPVVRRA